ncbi:Ribosome production factor 1 [Taenia crassiceps]|uniref:Ribosome production factor 1 n=1 Tax=Taenia crassiceps TaxID=6207 RepID=A0ABR4Q5L9_9CEST
MLIYSGAVEPKLLLTHSDRVTPHTIGFCKELSRVIPNTTLVPRWHLPLKKLIPKAIEHGYTALLVVNEDMKKLNTLVISHLPDGPTATFHVTNVTPRRKLRGLKNRGIEEGVIPHLILNRFMTALASRGPPLPHCRTVVFHNQRDFIFFRHYRYIHRKNSGASEDKKTMNDVEDGGNEEAGPSMEPLDRVVVNEVGPRFTLKLKSIQLGTFDSQFGDYEWVKKGAVIGKSRRTFVL